MALPAFPDESATLSLPGPAGALEVAVEMPEPDVAPVPAIAVVSQSALTSRKPKRAEPGKAPVE